MIEFEKGSKGGFFFLFIAFTLFAVSSCSKPENNEPEQLKILLDKLCKETGTPGAILAVKFRGNETTAVSSGYGDLETHTPMSIQSPYYLGSITKTYTAVTILLLVEEGRLSLEDTLERFVPDFPEGNKITVRHLLQHTSGLKDFYMYLYYRPDRDEMIKLVTKRWNQDELLKLSARFGRWFEPGTDWSYSSTNYYLLGVIIERASGLKLFEAYRHYIYKPLKLSRTWLPKHEKEHTTLPTGYMGRIQEWKHSEMFGELGPTTILDQSSVELSAGGLAAPASEAIQFLNGLFHEKLLSEKTLKTMMQFRPIPPLGVSDSNQNRHGRKDGYGLGLIKMELDGFTLLGHGGLYNGHTAGLWYIPDRDITIALYFNRGFIGQNEILHQLFPVITQMETNLSEKKILNNMFPSN